MAKLILTELYITNVKKLNKITEDHKQRRRQNTDVRQLLLPCVIKLELNKAVY